jgi:hypothetical protein
VRDQTDPTVAQSLDQVASSTILILYAAGGKPEKFVARRVLYGAKRLEPGDGEKAWSKGHALSGSSA